MNKIIKTLVWTCILLVIISCVGCKKREEPKPILKVITSSQVGVTIFSNKHYYIVYDNGKKKKTSKFDPSDVESYLFGSSNYEDPTKVLHGVDLDTEEGTTLNDIAIKIIALTEVDAKVYSPGTLYVIHGKYYFEASIDKGTNSLADALFEYHVDENTFENITSFNDEISHVEPYQ